jgi:hypothetical protein
MASQSPTVHFKFRHKDDMAFYILNAVCHDWIHDFNNYQRMSKILNYIESLVNPQGSTTSTGGMNGEDGEGEDDKDGVLNDTQKEDSVGLKTPITTATAFSLTNTIDQKYDKIQTATAAEGLSTIPEGEKLSVQPITTWHPDAPVKDKKYDILMKRAEELKKSTTSSNAADDAAGTHSPPGLHVNPSAPSTHGLSSQLTKQFINSKVSYAINKYFTMKTEYDEYLKTGYINPTSLDNTLDNMYILQQLEEFIGECKLLVISKLTSIKNEYNEKEEHDGYSGINCVNYDEILHVIGNIIDDINDVIRDLGNTNGGMPSKKRRRSKNRRNLEKKLKTDDEQPIIGNQQHSQTDNTASYVEDDEMGSIDQPAEVYSGEEDKGLHGQIMAVENIQNRQLDEVDSGEEDKGLHGQIMAVENIQNRQLDEVDSGEKDGDSHDEIMAVENIQNRQLDEVDSGEKDGDSHDDQSTWPIFDTPDYYNRLKSVFSLLGQVFVKIEINSYHGVHPLEIFNNSLISDIISSFVIGIFPRLLNNYEITNSVINDIAIEFLDGMQSYTSSGGGLVGGGPFSNKLYNENLNSSLWPALDTAIDNIKKSILYELYKGDRKPPPTDDPPGTIQTYLTELNAGYAYLLATNVQTAIEIICGRHMMNAKTNIINNKNRDVPNSSSRNKIKNVQLLTDAIVSFVFDDIINPYEDIKARVQETTKNENDGTEEMTPRQRKSVQKISQLVAKKTLVMTGLTPTTPSSTGPSSASDLQAQIGIINEVAINDKGYSSVDNMLIAYFSSSYDDPNNPTPNFINIGSLGNLIIKSKQSECRVINNAIQQSMIKGLIKKKVICPTSSVCDGMGSFGSCAPPQNEEYYNMDFMISSPGDDENEFYEGKTTLNDKKSIVSIEYGFKFGELQLYNFLNNIDIQRNPVKLLQANYTFKGVINRILEIWKGAQEVKDIEGLWDLLYHNDFFLSILQVGSQKAVGDIFQEVNSTLAYGGYSKDNNHPDEGVEIDAINRKTTFGLMGDRPSGIRVIKLLKDGASGVKPNACGGYISENYSLIYSNIPQNQAAQNTKPKGNVKTGKGGMTIKKFKPKTNTRKKKNNKKRKSIKKSKKNNKNTRRFAN